MMKTRRRLFIIICGVLLAFFLITLICFTIYYSGSFADNVLLSQLILFSVIVSAVIVYYLKPTKRSVLPAQQGVTRILLLSDMNTTANEYSLMDIVSARICRDGSVFISFEEDSEGEDYAVINRVKKHLYIERVSDKRIVGLKPAGEQYVYKLKSGICYKVNINDVIFIGNERLLLL